MTQRVVVRGMLPLLVILLVVWLQGCVPSSGTTKGGKSCLDCHEQFKQKFSAGIVHKPVKIGDCAGCHRKHGLIGGAYLKYDDAQLCFSCHQSLAGELTEKPRHHAPVAEGNCAACHQPHNSPNSGLLVQPKEQLCFDCHDKAVFTKQYLHPPMSKGCSTCHETHGAKVAKLLVKEEAKLCQDCHNIDKKSFIAKHGGYPVERGCSDCHSVHSADNPALLKDFTHQPVSALECSGCHPSAGSAEPFSVGDSSAELCYQCHQQEKHAFKVDSVHDPVGGGDCFACHNPHASDYVGISKEDPQQLCFQCHNFKFFGPQGKDGGYVHRPAGEGECLVCHAPHLAGKGQRKLLRKDASSLCADCHSEKSQQNPVNHQPARDGECLTCHMPHESRHQGVLTKPQRPLCADCHQQVGEGLGLPSLHRPFVAGECSACHNPHGGQGKQLLIANGVDACGKCHGTIETERKRARHKPFKEGNCELCHQSHGSQQPFLLAKESKELCIDCHHGQKPLAGTPPGHQNCSVCHYSHGNDEPGFLLKPQPELCLACHNVNRYWETGRGHDPAVKGLCDTCHDPHQPQVSRVDHAVELCATCHRTDVKTLSDSHKGIVPGKDSCLGCHDPHGGQDASLTLPVKHAPFAKGNCRSCHNGGEK